MNYGQAAPQPQPTSTPNYPYTHNKKTIWQTKTSTALLNTKLEQAWIKHEEWTNSLKGITTHSFSTKSPQSTKYPRKNIYSNYTSMLEKDIKKPW